MCNSGMQPALVRLSLGFGSTKLVRGRAAKLALSVCAQRLLEQRWAEVVKDLNVEVDKYLHDEDGLCVRLREERGMWIKLSKKQAYDHESDVCGWYCGRCCPQWDAVAVKIARLVQVQLGIWQLPTDEV